jgi:hypothetical protein
MFSPWLSATVSKFKEKGGDISRVVTDAARDVAQLTREVALDVAAPFRTQHSSLQLSSGRSAEDLSQSIEADAMRVATCTVSGASLTLLSASELLTRWTELVLMSGTVDGDLVRFTDADTSAELSFRQVLLRSRGVELVVASVASNPRLRQLVSEIRLNSPVDNERCGALAQGLSTR